MTRRWRAVAVAAFVLVTLPLALVPAPDRSPLARVVNLDGDGPDPQFDTPLDALGLRRAGALLPDDTTYFVHAPGASPLLQGNLKAATQLFLAPALPVQPPQAARWLVAYDAGGAPIRGLRIAERRRVGRLVELVRVADDTR